MMLLILILVKPSCASTILGPMLRSENLRFQLSVSPKLVTKRSIADALVVMKNSPGTRMRNLTSFGAKFLLSSCMHVFVSSNLFFSFSELDSFGHVPVLVFIPLAKRDLQNEWLSEDQFSVVSWIVYPVEIRAHCQRTWSIHSVGVSRCWYPAAFRKQSANH